MREFRNGIKQRNVRGKYYQECARGFGGTEWLQPGNVLPGSDQRSECEAFQMGSAEVCGDFPKGKSEV